MLHRLGDGGGEGREAGLAAGGKDDGEPAQRAEFGPSYFSAYLRDPDGYRLEVAVGSD